MNLLKYLGNKYNQNKEIKEKSLNEKQNLLNEYNIILKKNQQELQEIKKEKYYIDSKGYDNNSFCMGYSFIKNNILSFLEEIYPINNANKLTIDQIKSKIKEPYRINIKFDEIRYYNLKGKIETKQQVSGTGGGSSLGGAILGGVIAGSTGAIIGSRKDIEIKTTEYTTDTRSLIVKTIDNKEYVFYCWQLYETLFDLIPEKDYDVYKKSLNQNTKKVNQENDNLEQLEKLAKLKEKGIITQEEFEKSKKKILSKL